MRGAQFFCSVLALSAAMAAPTWAQSAQGGGVGSTDVSLPSTGGDITVADIVVTAQRRSERLEEVPIAVAAISPMQISTLGIVTAKDIQLAAPGLNFQSSYGYAQPYIRGIGTQSPNPGIESSTAIYIDGIYQPHASGAIVDLFDMGGVQVLRGAQGTLYGRNASGGAILYAYAEPVIDEQSFKVDAEYGSRDHVQGSIVANLPLAPNAALRLGAQYVKYGNFINNVVDGRGFGGRKAYNLRGKLKWEASDDLTVDLTAEHVDSNDRDTAQAVRAPAAYCAACNIPIPGADLNPTSGFYDVGVNSHQSARYYTFTRVSAKISYSGEKFDINSLSYWFKDRIYLFSDQGGSTTFSLFDYDPDQGGKIFGEEFQVVTKMGGLVDFMVGVSYQNQDDFNSVVFNGLAFGGLTDLRTDNFIRTKSLAGFGEAYIRPTDRLKFTLGGRYTHDERKLDALRAPSTMLAYDPGGNPRFSQKTSSNVFTARVVADYDLDDFHAYAGWTTGYKAGGFNVIAIVPTNAIEPEKISNFEGGLKYVAPSRKFRSNLAIFYYKYRNAQVQVTNLSAGGQFLTNAGTARGYGAELDFNFKPEPWISLFGSAAYLNAKYLSYKNGAIVTVDPATNTLINNFADLSGVRLPRAPRFVGTAGFSLNGDLGANLSGQFSTNVRYTTNYDFYPAALGPLRYSYQSGYALVNMSADIKRPLSSDGSSYMTIGLYANNVFDQKYSIQRVTQANFGLIEIVAEPRVIGVRAGVTF